MELCTPKGGGARLPAQDSRLRTHSLQYLTGVLFAVDKQTNVCHHSTTRSCTQVLYSPPHTPFHQKASSNTNHRPFTHSYQNPPKQSLIHSSPLLSTLKEPQVSTPKAAITSPTSTTRYRSSSSWKKNSLTPTHETSRLTNRSNPRPFPLRLSVQLTKSYNQAMSSTATRSCSSSSLLTKNQEILLH